MNAFSHGTIINWAALAVAILGSCNVETAFEKIQSDKPSTVKPELDQQDLQDAIKFKREGLTWNQIGEIYDASGYAIRRRVERVAVQG